MNLIPLVIGVGSNTEDREFRLTQAIEALCAKFSNASVSDVYETPAYNGKDDPYMNAVFSGYTDMTQDGVVKFLKEMESEAGRTAVAKLEGHIALDVDLVIWDRKIVRPTDFERSYFNIGYRQLLANGAFQYNV